MTATACYASHEEMLIADNKRFREAGCELAEAAMSVAKTYDGVHRLKLALSKWALAIANEGGRDLRTECADCEGSGWADRYAGDFLVCATCGGSGLIETRTVEAKPESEPEPETTAEEIRQAMPDFRLHVNAKWKSLYHELLWAVESTYEGESRHGTALRYIREREAHYNPPASDSPTNASGTGLQDANEGKS